MANYYYEFNNNDGDLYKVQFKDSVSEDELLLIPDGNGFTLSWEGGGSGNSYKAIMSSSFECGLHIETNSIALLGELAGSTMGTFEVVISKENVPIWFGFVLQDSMVQPDAYTYCESITIQATDGFGELQDQEWTEFSLETPQASRTIIEWFAEIMSKMPLTYTTSAVIQSASVWYDDSHPSGPEYDPLARTIINEAAFANVEDFKDDLGNIISTVKGFTYYDILSDILNTFNLQISHANGRYLIIQQNTYSQTTTRAWNYTKAGVFVSTQLLSLQDTMDQRMTGGTYNFLAPIRKIQASYEFKQGLFRNNLLPYHIVEGTEYNIGPSTVDAILNIRGKIKTKYEGASYTDFARVQVVYKLQLRCDTWYLNSDLEWVEDNTVYVEIKTRYMKAYGSTLTVITPFFIQTPMPVDDELMYLTLTFFELRDDNEETWEAEAGYEPTMTHTLVDGSWIVNVTDDGVEQEGTKIYEAHVNEAIKYDLELETTHIGDGITPLSAGAMTVIDSSNDNVASNAWTIYSEIGGTAMEVHHLRCREMLALRRVTTCFYEGSFIGSPDVHKGFYWETKYWVPTQISWDVNENTYTGTALQLNYATDPS